MRFWQRRRSRQGEIETAAENWLARNGDRAYGLARERIHDAWRLGDYGERDRWMRIRAALRRHDRIIHLLDLALKASDEGQKRAASALVRLLRSGRSDIAALEELAGDLASTWGPEIKSYYWQLCRKLGLCD